MKRKSIRPLAAAHRPLFSVFAAILLTFIPVGGFCLAEDSAESPAERLQTLRAKAEAAGYLEKTPLLDAIIDEFSDNGEESVREIVAWAMLTKANYNFGEKQDGLYALVIDTFGDSANAEIRWQVAQAKYKRIRWDSEAKERIPVLAAIVDEYANDPDPRIREIVEDAAIDKARAEEKPDSVIALCDEIIARLADRKDDEARERTAGIMLRRAMAIRDPALRIRALDNLISTYGNDTGKAASYVDSALSRKAEIVGEKSEKNRLLDEVLARFAKRTGLVNSMIFDERVERAETREEKKAVYDSLLSAAGDYLEPGRRARLMVYRVSHVKQDSEKIPLYRMVVDSFGADGDESTDRYVKQALEMLTRLVQDDAEKGRLHDAIVELCRNSSNSYVHASLTRSILDRAESGGDPDEMKRVANDVIERFIAEEPGITDWDFQSAARLMGTAAKDRSFRTIYYDMVIERHPSEKVVVWARQEKARWASDAEEKTRLFGDLIAHHRDSDDSSVQTKVLLAMDEKAELVKSSAEKVALYREIVEKYQQPGDSFAASYVRKAIDELAKLTGDTGQAIRYYDKSLAKAEDDKQKARLSMDKAAHLGKSEKIKLYDEIIEKYQKSHDRDMQMLAMTAMLEKASTVSSTEEKNKLYEHVMFGFSRYDRNIVSTKVDDAFWKAFDLATSWYFWPDKEKRRNLIERYLAFHKDRISALDLIRILYSKIELAESPEVAIRAYDEIIALGTNEDGGGPLADMTRHAAERAASERAKLIIGQKE